MKTFQLISLYFCRLLKITWILEIILFIHSFVPSQLQFVLTQYPLFFFFLQKILYMYDHTRYLKTVEGHCTSTYRNGQNVPIHDRKSGQVVASMYVSLTQV